MNTTIEERKHKALEIMQKLDIYKPYIEGFMKDDLTCYYENFGGFWAWQNKELANKIKEIEEKHNCTVYAVTHEFTEFGELYDFLIVTDCPEEWNELYQQSTGNQSYVFAYCWNKDDDFCSEFGDIVVASFGGGIRRIA